MTLNPADADVAGMRKSLMPIMAFVAGGLVVILLGAAPPTQPAMPRYQLTPWGDSDTLIVVDNSTNEASILAQEYDEKTTYSAPWRSIGKFSLDEATRTPSTRYKPGMLRPHITSHWNRKD